MLKQAILQALYVINNSIFITKIESNVKVKKLK